MPKVQHIDPVEMRKPGFEFESWGGMVAPAKTPRPIITRLNREVGAALGAPDVQQRMRALGAEPVATTPEAYDRRIATEIANIGAIARRAGITPQ
jgi:tripartite-type tricarboxylate transporter receptor subunit TctC